MRFTQPIALLLLSASFASPPVLPQSSPVVGVVAISNDASSGTVPLSAGATIYSGESLQTAKAGRLQIRVGTLQLALSASSAARVFRNDERVIVQLQAGSLAYSARTQALPLTIFADDIKFAPLVPQGATGHIELLSRCSVSAYVSQGAMEVISANGSRIVREGQRYAASAEFSVAYDVAPKSARNEVPPDWSDPLFHAQHQHLSCDGVSRSSVKKMPLIEKVVVGAASVATAVGVIKSVESPDQP